MGNESSRGHQERSTAAEDSILALNCEICYRSFSAVANERLPYVGQCGHTFCAECASKLNGKCGNCRADINLVKNYSLIECLDKMEKLKEFAKEKKEELLAAGIVVEDYVEVGQESAKEEDVREVEGAETVVEAELRRDPTFLQRALADAYHRGLFHNGSHNVDSNVSQHSTIQDYQPEPVQREFNLDHLPNPIARQLINSALATLPPDAAEFVYNSHVSAEARRQQS